MDNTCTRRDGGSSTYSVHVKVRFYIIDFYKYLRPVAGTAHQCCLASPTNTKRSDIKCFMGGCQVERVKLKCDHYLVRMCCPEDDPQWEGADFIVFTRVYYILFARGRYTWQGLQIRPTGVSLSSKGRIQSLSLPSHPPDRLFLCV